MPPYHISESVPVERPRQEATNASFSAVVFTVGKPGKTDDGYSPCQCAEIRGYFYIIHNGHHHVHENNVEGATTTRSFLEMYLVMGVLSVFGDLNICYTCKLVVCGLRDGSNAPLSSLWFNM